MTDAGKAALAYQDARTSPLTHTRQHLLELADALAEAALILVEDHRGVLREREELQTRVEAESCPNPFAHQLDPDDRTLAALVRQEHDIAHRDPWSICGFATCRQAIKEGQD